MSDSEGAARVGRLLKQRELKRSRESDSSTSPPPDGRRRSPSEEPKRQRLLVVANRLPVSAVRTGQDSWKLEVSAGGLVSALTGVDFEARWIGWAGLSVEDDVSRQALIAALAEKKCIPVFLSEEIANGYYNGYCNNILWPLFHYLGIPREDRLDTTRSFQSQFEAYREANKKFAEVVNQHYEEGDIVWCHDYHLMFLPEELKKHNPTMKVGWFLHTPFPSSEIHRTLPSRAKLLRAVLSADLLGFHTYDYARHFVSSCARILGLEGRPDGVEDQGRLTRVSAFPIGIDASRFIQTLENPKVQDIVKDLLERFGGKKIMLGVDRLDMIKGIPQKLLAFEKFLEENPQWQNKVVLLQIAVPTRTEVSEYKKLTSQVHEIVGRINGRFGSMSAVPIVHLDRSLDFHALCALYSITDVALVTSLRDGMNLVSYEFVACQDSKKGVLILSEFAGAAQSLGAGAILVNPWNVSEVAGAIARALTMPAEEREKRHSYNFAHVKTHSSQKWAEFFVNELNDTVIEAQERISKVPPQLVLTEAVNSYAKSTNRLIILGFNSVLTEAIDGRKGGDQIKEMELILHPDLKEPLRVLSSDPNTIVLILSGSERRVLEKNFGEYNMWLAAENGVFLRCPDRTWMAMMPESSNIDWVENIKQVFEYFTERTPRSHFERRETLLTWNHKYSDEFGRLQATDMMQHLSARPIANSAVDVIQGSHSVEVRPFGVTKGAAMLRIMGTLSQSKIVPKPIDYVLCLGHLLQKDEDIYGFFEPEVPPVSPRVSRSSPRSGKRAAAQKHVSEAQGKTDLSTDKNPTEGSTSQGKTEGSTDKKATEGSTFQGTSEPSTDKNPTEGSSPRAPLVQISDVLTLNSANYFSCAVGRTRSKARYMVNSSDDVVELLKELANATAPAPPS